MSCPLVEQDWLDVRVLACRSRKKEPNTPESLNNLVAEFAQPEAPLADVHTVTVYLLDFARFFCYSKLMGLRETDISIFPEHMELFLESSKTEQHREQSSYGSS